ncbi:hypothetical protein LX97_02722 [Nonlabens dokdonensis]|jgi:hypothetical protein|uniref:Uncharacterized protein n=2 Tax=Nonlabens dokdonensis TaxID=328515 RepID=L7WEP0_NONDD|nr:hypothetical protein [Nonlabens dokdonensis]AGC78391.1 hypothetical protein DDD_3264 [Nonlabens dokdonensis DSW-6]PZX38141.1 hypothetical protein LX97_02722 [Nonlabens dokdonensis]
MKKIVSVIILLFLFIFIAGYLYLYQDHRDVNATVATNSFNSSELLSIFQDADIENDKEILDQVILITGVATSKSAYTVTLDDKIFIEFNHKDDETFKYIFKVNETYTIKGRCLGYDDLLEEVKMDQAILENENPK